MVHRISPLYLHSKAFWIRPTPGIHLGAIIHLPSPPPPAQSHITVTLPLDAMARKIVHLGSAFKHADPQNFQTLLWVFVSANNTIWLLRLCVCSISWKSFFVPCSKAVVCRACACQIENGAQSQTQSVLSALHQTLNHIQRVLMIAEQRQQRLNAAQTAQVEIKDCFCFKRCGWFLQTSTCFYHRI